MPVDVQRLLVERFGAMIEHSYVAVVEGLAGMPPLPIEAVAEQTEGVGAASCIRTTDFGQPHNALFVDGLGQFADVLGGGAVAVW
jgi:hypothetical protein